MTPLSEAEVLLPRAGSSQTGDAGVGFVQLQTNTPKSTGGLDFIFRPQPNVDLGIDGHLEIVNHLTREATGRFIGVQVKTGASHFQGESRSSWNVYIAKSTMEYWRRYSVPVILVLVDLNGRVGYWTRVDVGDFEEAAHHNVVPVSRSRIYDASSREALANLAQNAPPSLRSRIELPEDLIAGEKSFDLAIATARTILEWCAVAEVGVELFTRMRRAGFPFESTRVARNAVRAFLHAGQQSKAYTTLTNLLKVALAELRDPSLAHSLRSSAMSAPTTSGWPTPTVIASPSELLEFECVDAEIAALLGDVSLASVLASRLQALAEGFDSSDNLRMRERSLRLNALAAVVTEDHERAAREYQALSLLASDATDKVAFTLRYHLHAGIQHDPGAHETAVDSLSVPEQLDVERHFILGWLQSRVNAENAAKTFLAAGEAALKLTDSYAAMRAFRNAAWAMNRSASGMRQVPLPFEPQSLNRSLPFRPLVG